jgi:hypothetical protein
MMAKTRITVTPLPAWRFVWRLRDRTQNRILEQQDDGREKNVAHNKPGHWL